MSLGVDVTNSPEWRQGEAIAVPHSASTAAPLSPAPPRGVDCHIHIFDPRWPRQQPKPSDLWCTVADEMAKRCRTGLSRCVIVHPSSYGTNNGALLDALDSLGDSARGVIHAGPEVSDAQLDALHNRGVRGVRLYLNGSELQPQPATVQQLAERLAPRGWHLEFVVREKQLLEAGALLAGLPCCIVIAHFAHLRPGDANSRAAGIVRKLLDSESAYLKLSAAYTVSSAPPPHYADLREWAAVLSAWAPDQILWGSDWPHPTAPENQARPDDAVLFDELTIWVPGAALRNKILVDNPDRLYWAV